MARARRVPARPERRRSLWRRFRRATRRPRNAFIARAITVFGALIGALPVSVGLALGRALGTVAHVFMGRPRRLAIQHMGIAFPDMSLEARTRLSRETFRHAGLSFMELALWRKLARRREYVAIEGASALDDAVATGRGCIAVSGHLGNWELLAATIAARYPLTVVAREVNDRHFQRLIFDFRTAAGAEVLLRDDDSFWQAVRGALKRGRIVALLIDQDTRGAGVFVPFFGRPAHTPHGAALLALRARVPVVTAFVERRPEGGHLIRLTPVATGPTSGGRSRVIELTARLTAAIEAQIRRAPAEWVWWHERWRRQPPAGEAQQAGDYLYSPGTPW